MVLATLSLLVLGQSGPALGDRWKVERSYRFLNESPKVDFTRKEETEYTVDSVDAKGITISQSRQTLGATQGDGAVLEGATPKKTAKLKFGPGGAPNYGEDASDLVQAMVDRVQWSAAEERAGVSWTRHFASTGLLKGAKLTMKPTSSTADSKTVAVTYLEDGGGVKGEATVMVALPKHVVWSLNLTFTGVMLEGSQQLVKVAVNQQLANEGK